MAEVNQSVSPHHSSKDLSTRGNKITGKSRANHPPFRNQEHQASTGAPQGSPVAALDGVAAARPLVLRASTVK